jgi:O-methyltransferase
MADDCYLPPRPPVRQPKPTLPQTIPDLFEEYPDKLKLFNCIMYEYGALSADTFDPIRIIQFFHMLAAANALPEGDYAELGTYGGLTLKVIHKLMDPSRTLYSLDTFEGFDERDIAIEKTKYNYDAAQEWFSRPTPENVGRYVGDGERPPNLEIIKGWFPDSFAGLEPIRWRFVHIDLDLYQPIKTALETFWKPLLPGGIIVVHDYGCYSFRAARMAVDEFCNAIGVLPTEMPDRWGSAVIRKPLSDPAFSEVARTARGSSVKIRDSHARRSRSRRESA